MSHIVAVGLEWEVGIHQSLNTRVPECVRSGMMNLHAGFVEVFSDSAGHGSIAKWPAGSQGTEKYVTVGGVGSTMLEVINQGLSDHSGQRVGG